MASSITRPSSSSTTTTTTSSGGSAKAMVADQITQAVQSTSNLLHLMQQSSPSQAKLAKLPKNLLAKCSTIRNTGEVLERLPQVIASLDAHTESGLQSVPHLKTVVQLLENIESSQLSSVSQGNMSQEKHNLENQHPEAE